MELEVGISHLRDTLGIAVQHVTNTDEPIIVWRYRRTDVVLVPLWEWRSVQPIPNSTYRAPNAGAYATPTRRKRGNHM